MDRKKIIIFASTGIAFSLVVFTLFYLGGSTEREIRKKSLGFVKKWGNFTDQSSDAYLESLRPYETDSLFESQKEAAESLKAMSGKYGPTGSRVTVSEKSYKIKKEGKEYKVSLKVHRQILPEKTKISYDEVISLTLTKEKGWLVDDVSSQKLN